MRIRLVQPGVRGFRWSILLGLLTAGLLLSSGGCTRRFFQRRADSEVDNILYTKDKYAQWKLSDYFVWPHPLSRFADPTDWNRPPMPPDDPAAWDLSPHPQRPIFRGHAYWQGTGYLDLMAKWDKENRARHDEEQKKKTPVEEEGEEPLLPGETKTFEQRMAEIETQINRELNSATTTTKALPEDFGAGQNQKSNAFLLNMDQIAQLGFLNSREFQTQREELYLTALSLTAQRFSFIAQPYLTEVVLRQRSATDSRLGQNNNWLSTTNAGFTKLFSTGALLLFNFANQTVYNLGQNPLFTSTSNVNLDFIQPFLAGGGRAVALEPLTQTERNVVYAIRQFFRFRQEFFVFFAAGQANFIPGVAAGVLAITPSAVAQPGAFVPGPFTLPLVANPATVQVAPQPYLNANFGAGVTTTPQGYLNTVTERGVLANNYKNIQNLQRFLVLLRAYVEGGLANQVQAGLVEQQLLRSIESTLGAHATYRISLDQLKQQLGLPMTVEIDVDLSPLGPMLNLVNGYEKLFIDTERVAYNAQQLYRASEPGQLRQRLHRLIDRTPLLRGSQTRRLIESRWNYWENLYRDLGEADRLEALAKRLQQLGQELFKLDRERGKRPGEEVPEEDKLRQDRLYLERDVAAFEYSLSVYERQPWKNENEAIRLERSSRALRQVNAYLIAAVGRAVVERQEQIKASWPALPRVCAGGVDMLSAPEDEALLAAERTVMTSRVDLMNVRAQLVDGWRKIRVAANALMGTFNVDYHFESATPAGVARPFSFLGSRNINQLYFNTSLPLVRILQRNNYRSTLVYFQQARRNLMAYEDQLLFNIRLDLRNLRVASNNIQRVQKRAIELAYQQVDQALQAFSQPQAPPASAIEPQGLVGPVAGRPQVGDPAALTQQLLNTQSSLLGAQNDLYNTWIGYLTNRMYFFRDLGTIRFDNRGVWIDDDSQCSCNSADNNDNPASAGSSQPAQQQQQPSSRPEQLPQPRPEPTAQSPALEPAR